MNSNKETNIYDSVLVRCAPATAWVVESHGTIVINADSGKVITLRYPQSAIWDLIAQEYPYERIISLISIICGSSRAASAGLIKKCLNDWIKNRILQIEHG